jgi:SAM-dependent methyltransferase
MECRVCKNSNNNEVFEIKENMYSTGEVFKYFQCSKCKTLQIANMPENISAYYDNSSYYSFFNKQSFSKKLRQWQIKNLIKNDILAKLYNFFFPLGRFSAFVNVKPSLDAKIIDIACGNGEFLYQLKNCGYKNLCGIDPFIKESIIEKNLSIYKKSIFELDEKFDFIMLNHSFEHMAENLQTLQKISELLDENGVCVIRIPTVDSYAWKTYKGNWVQIDAPRHFFLYSIEGFKYLVDKTNLKIINIEYDADSFQFWGSETVQKGKPFSNVKASIQLLYQLKYLFKIKYHNNRKSGDSIAIYLRL